MHDSILRALEFMKPDLRRRWEILLRQAPTHSPLAAPDVLVYLMEWTIEELIKILAGPPQRRRLRTRTTRCVAEAPFLCPCGANPLQTYFSCLDRSLTETLEHVYNAVQCDDPVQRDLIAAEVRLAFEVVSRRELQTFCSVCRHARGRAPLVEHAF